VNATAPTPPKPSHRLRNRVVGIAIAVGLYAIVGGLLVPPVVKKVISDKAREKLGRVVVIDDLTFNPFTLAATAKGFRIMEADGTTPFATFDQLDIDGSITSVYRLAPVADEVTLAGLKVNLVRDSDTHYNISDILTKLAAPPAKPASGKSEFSVSNIRLTNARIDFDDRPKGKKHVVNEIDIAIPFISNLPTHLKEFVQPSFAAKVNGTSLRLKGETLPFENSLRTHIALDMDSLDLTRYVEYSPSPLPVSIDAGKLDAKLSVRFTQAAGKDPSVDVTGTLALRDLKVSAPDDGGTAQVARIDADIASLDPIAGLVKVRTVKVTDATLARGPWRIASTEVKDIRVDAGRRRVEIASLVSSDGAIDATRQREGVELPLKIKPSDSPPWDVMLGKLALDGYRVAIHDATLKPAAGQRLNVVHLEASDLSTEKGAKSTMAAHLTMDKSGSIDLESAFALSPLEASVKVDARHVDIALARRYVDKFKTVALKSGFASAKGTFTLRGEGDAMQVGYTGAAGVSNLATVDTTINEDLLNWDAVRMTGIALRYSEKDPLNLAIAEIGVDKAYSRVVVNPDGKLNLQQLLAATPAEPEAPAPAPAPAPGDAKPRNVRIDRITFKDSRLDFTDHFIQPNYSADVGGLSGTVTNLSSDPASRGVVDLQGSYDKVSPVTIAGTVNPLSGDLFLDIAAKGKDIELPKLSAYSLRYAGFGITKGKLTLDVKYHIEHGKLEGRNRIFLDQLTFGDHVDGPDATKLPVLFAVNLLKNSKGEIDLELPISGSLEDPQFAIGALLGQVVTNLLKKALTAPFSLLTAALGGNGGGSGSATGGDDLAFVEFEPGRDDISAASQKKLDAVSKALLDRPAIHLELATTWDAQKDSQALKGAALARRVKEAKRAALGKAAPPLDEITIGEGEYARYLKIVYEQEAPPKPAPKNDAAKNDAAKAKDAAPKEISSAEMEAFLLEHISVSDEELRALSARRLEKVKGYLVAQGRLPPDRVLVAANSPDASNAKASRVDFTLK
jgi:uncharacterized protein involved in outer membrane biogenesis